MASQLFLRHYPGQTPSSNDPGAGWTDSPDIWLNGMSPAANPQALRDSYGTESANTFYLNEDNFVYVRGLDNDGSSITARFWLYYTQSDVVIWPQSWRTDGITVAGVPRNWVDAKADSKTTIAVSDPPFVAKPTNPAPGQHYCMIAYAQTPPSDTSPAPTGSIGTWNDLAALVQGNPQMAWRNTFDVAASAPSTWQINAPITGAEAGGTFWLGALCKDMPVGGNYDCYVPGPDDNGSINLTGVPIKKADQTFMVPITWPPGYKRGMTIVYHGAGAPAPGKGAQIVPVTGGLSSKLEGVLDDPYKYARQVTVYDTPRLEGGQDAYMLFYGSVPFSITTEQMVPFRVVEQQLR